MQAPSKIKMTLDGAMLMESIWIERFAREDERLKMELEKIKAELAKYQSK